MISENQIELISIATESGNHARLAEELIGCGINVIVEKPLALNIDDADRIVKLSRAKKKLKLAFVTRTDLIPPFRF